MTPKEARAHAESALRQLTILGRKPRIPIDPDAFERAAEAAQVERNRPATKEDIENLNRRLDLIEKELRNPTPIFTNVIAGERLRRGVRPT
jgi:hypothetical protein